MYENCVGINNCLDLLPSINSKLNNLMLFISICFLVNSVFLINNVLLSLYIYKYIFCFSEYNIKFLNSSYVILIFFVKEPVFTCSNL